MGARELWRKWPKNERYLVSSSGKCLGIIKGGKSRVTLMPQISNIGYLEYKLRVHGKQKTVGAHRLVAETFIPNPNNLSDVHHIDENKLNNNVSNLMWVSHKENCNLGTRKERAGAKSKARWAEFKKWKEMKNRRNRRHNKQLGGNISLFNI